MSYVRPLRPVAEPVLSLVRQFLSTTEKPWKLSRQYMTLDATQLLGDVLSSALDRSVTRAFFLKLPPGAQVHRHVDTGDVETWHMPVTTNARAFSCWIEGGDEARLHLAVGMLYVLDRTVEHWAVNDGDTERTHLIVEFAR